jgi:hypothetical protein
MGFIGRTPCDVTLYGFRNIKSQGLKPVMKLQIAKLSTLRISAGSRQSELQYAYELVRFGGERENPIGSPFVAAPKA